MKQMIISPKTIAALTLGGALMVSAQVFSQDQATVDYQTGYNLILEQSWEDALEYFENFSEQWPDSAWSDDAAFWSCYSTEQQQVAEESEYFSCYQQFIASYPRSSWVADASTKLAVLGSELAALGYPDYINQVSDDWDFDFDFDDYNEEVSRSIEYAMEVVEEEMGRVRVIVDNIEIPDMPDFPDFPEIDEEDVENYRRIARSYQQRVSEISRGRNSADNQLLTIVGALRNDDRVSEILLDRLESSDNPNLRSRIVMLLEDVPGDEIDTTLLEVMENDESEQVRDAAIVVLLDRDNEASRDRLRSIATDDSYPIQIRAEIIGELDDWESSEAIETLERILETESDPRLIAEAADALSDLGTPQALEVLIGSFNSIEDPELRRELLDEIADVETDMVLQFLVDVGSSPDVDDFIAATAIEGIADRENGIAVASLETIYMATDSTQRKLAALNGMGDTETTQAVFALSQIVNQEDDPEILAAAVRALGDTELPGAVEPIMQTYRNTDDAGVRNRAVRALRRLEDYPEARDGMLEVLEDQLNAELSDQ